MSRKNLAVFYVGLLAFVACGRSGMEDEFEALETGGAAGVDAGVGGSSGAGGIAVGGGGVSSGGVGGGVAGAGAFGGFAGSAASGGIVGTGGIGQGGSAGAAAAGGVGGIGTGGIGTGGIGQGGSAGTAASGGVGTGGIGTGGIGTGGVDAGPPDGNFFDSFPFPDSGPIATCLECAEQNCSSQVNTCFNNPTCAGGTLCAITSCGGGFNLGCILTCFQGDFVGAFQAFSAFSCLAQSCGQQCVGAIVGGGGGGAGNPPPPVPPPSPAAGGIYGVVSPADAALLALPAGPMYLPPIEVLDAIPSFRSSCAGYRQSCR